MSTYIMRKGNSRLQDLADGALAGLFAGIRGNVYFVDPTNGNDGSDGQTPAGAKATLAAAYALTTANQNDVVFFIGGPTGDSPAAANDLAVLFTLPGNGCIVKNIQFFDGKDSAADGACVLVSGSRNLFQNVFVAGMGDATASGPATRAGSYSLKVSGSENAFVDCTVGLDTIERTAANSELIVSAARNRFIHCEFRSNSTTAGKFLVKIDNSGGDLRDTQFDDCLFYNYTTNWATGITDAFDMPSGGSTHDVILRGNCQIVGVGTGWADTVTRLMGAGAVPNAGYGISIAPTT